MELVSMPRTVNIADAKAQLSHLITRAEGGEEIVIARSGVPAARIVPINRPVAETIELLREERTRRPHVPMAEIRSARVEGLR